MGEPLALFDSLLLHADKMYCGTAECGCAETEKKCGGLAKAGYSFHRRARHLTPESTRTATRPKSTRRSVRDSCMKLIKP